MINAKATAMVAEAEMTSLQNIKAAVTKKLDRQPRYWFPASSPSVVVACDPLRKRFAREQASRHWDSRFCVCVDEGKAVKVLCPRAE